MTREEEKNKARFKYVSERLANPDFPTYNAEYELEAAFDEGAEWADRTMIDKACEWLHSALYLDHERSIEHRYATLEELLNDFRKAMKGD